jgi:hypothetical protein
VQFFTVLVPVGNFPWALAQNESGHQVTFSEFSKTWNKPVDHNLSLVFKVISGEAV